MSRRRKVSLNRWGPGRDSCRVCGRSTLRHRGDGMCTACYVMADNDAWGQFHCPQGRTRVKFNVNGVTKERLNWLCSFFGASQEEVTHMAVNLLYDVLITMSGRIEVTPQGLSSLVARIRLSIVQAGVEAQQKKLAEKLADRPEERTVNIRPAKAGGQIAGRLISRH